MILAVDIGNTNTVLGCFSDNKILFTERLSTDPSRTMSEYAINIKIILELNGVHTDEIDGAILSSVVPPLNQPLCEAIKKATGADTLVVGPGIKTGLNIAIDNPAQVGSDLVVSAVAALEEYPLPVIIIDMGTATTFSVIDRKKNYIGGIIMPGVKISMDALVSETSQLPRISLEAPKHVIGRNTDEAMKSGTIYGNAVCLDGMIDRIEEELGESTTVIATGGLASTVIPQCRHEITLDDDILLKGLMVIYRKNS